MTAFKLNQQSSEDVIRWTQAKLQASDASQNEGGEQGQRGKQRAGTKSLPLMFVGVLTMLAAPVKSEEEFKAVGYDCSSPTNIKV